jgi:general L-amino acid transport system permease protein
MPDETRHVTLAPLPPALTFAPKPAEPPPPSTIGVIGWMRANLFSAVPNTLLTLIGAYVVYSFFAWVIEWALVNAVSSRRECLDAVGRSGACWPGVIAWLPNLIYGLYPKD